MKVIIVGAGKIGSTLVESLIEEKHDIVVIDSNPKVIDNLVNKYDVIGVTGGGCEKEILLKAEINEADFFIACTPYDEHNIICCILAKKLGAKFTVARIHDTKYFDEMVSMREDFGLDFAFNPEYRTAREIVHILKHPFAKSAETFSRGSASMVKFDVKENSPLLNKSLIEIANDFGRDVIFGVVERDQKVFIPRGDFVIKEKDCVTVLASETKIIQFFKKINVYKSQVKSVLIIGGGNIAYYLAKLLIDLGVSVKIIEKDKDRANELASSIPKAIICNADGTEEEVLEAEELQSFDACVTLTGIDEENVIISLYAQHKDVGKVVAKVDRSSINNLSLKLGLDSLVSPRHVIASRIIRFIREKESKIDNSLNSLYKITNTVEVVEISVTEKFSKIDAKLKDIRLKNNTLIGGIVRNSELLLPTGETSLMLNDKVLVITAVKGLKDLNQILK